MKIDEPNTDNSTKIYLNKINIVLYPYSLLTRINKYKLKFKSESWIALSLKRPIFVKKGISYKFNK